jgi:hypothetical protein
MADGSENTLAMIVEATAGTTPATPAFKNLRIVNETLTANFEALVSNELRADATVSDVRRTGISVSGDINFELHKSLPFEDLLAAALRGTWTTNVVKGGVLKPAYTLERKIIGSAATAYLRFAGSRIGGLSLSLTPEEIITGSFKVMGTAHTAATAIITGATYAPVSSSPVMAGVDVTSLAVSGVAGVDYTNLTIDIDNNLRVQRKLGSTSARGIGYGRRQITGTLGCYFEDLTAYNAFLNNSTPSITATASDGTDTFTITVPKIRITGGEVPSPGNDQDIMLNLTWQAIYDSGITSDIQIARNAAGV